MRWEFLPVLSSSLSLESVSFLLIFFVVVWFCLLFCSAKSAGRQSSSKKPVSHWLRMYVTLRKILFPSQNFFFIIFLFFMVWFFFLFYIIPFLNRSWTWRDLFKNNFDIETLDAVLISYRMAQYTIHYKCNT